MQNKIFTTQNQPLSVGILTDGAGQPIPYNTLSGLPLGSANNAQDGELALKVIIVGQRESTGTGGSGNGIINSGSAKGLIAVTPDDDDDLADLAAAVMTTDGGDIKITDNDGNDTVIEDVIAGMIIPVQAKRIWATGTTATKIYALYH